MLPVFLVELLGTVILIHRFLAKDTSKIPFSSEDCKTLRTLECVNRAMVTAGKFQLSHWSKLGPLCCLLLLFEFGRQAQVRGLNGRLGGSRARGADLSVGISCCGNTGRWPRLFSPAEPRNRGGSKSWARREEMSVKAAAVQVWGEDPETRHQETCLELQFH